MPIDDAHDDLGTAQPPSRIGRFVRRLLLFEGFGYSNDPTDPGGATFCGISRNANPSWPGWVKVDALLAAGKAPTYDDLPDETEDFYGDNYWIPSGADKISDSELSYLVFDTAVNFGVKRAIELLAIAQKPDVTTTLRLARIRYRLGRVEQRPDQLKYLHGWVRRDCEA